MAQTAHRKSRKVNNNFGRDADVTVTGDSVYKGKSGRVVNGVLNPDGTYLVALGIGTGDQFIHADDLSLTDEATEPEPAVVAEYQASLLLPLEAIRPDANQPRKRVNEEALADLALSIKEHGVLQPIIVRPVQGEANAWKIVFGERRWRASQLAGLTHLPALVRDMSDSQALVLQVIENLQRSDVHPMDEARAFRTMHEDDALTTEEIGHRIGKGKTYVRTRLRLVHLTADWQQIYLDGHINFEEAGLLCRATPAVQEQILAEANKTHKPGDAQWRINNLAYQLKQGERSLEAALFDTTDPKLYPEMGACTTCPFNSSVNELFAEEGRAVCNNAGCYAIKTDRQYQAELLEAAAKDDVIMLSHYAYSAPDLARVKTAQELGLAVLQNDAVQVVKLKPEPVLDELAAKFPELTEEALGLMFHSTHKKWKDAQLQIEAARADGRLKKAFVVAGNNAGTYQDVIVAKPAGLSAAAPAPAKSGKDLLRNISEEQAGIDPSEIREAATERYRELLDDDAGNFKGEGMLTLPAEETALILYLWNQLWMEDEARLLPIQAELGLEPDDEEDDFVRTDNMALFNCLMAKSSGERENISGNLARALILSSFNSGDYENDGEAAALRAIAFGNRPSAAREIDADIMQQLQKA